MGELEVIKVQATDPFAAVEELDKEAAERADGAVAKKRLYEVNGELAPSADSIDAAVAARELERDPPLGIEMEAPEWRLFKDIDPADETTWIWQATVRGANYDIKNGVRAGYNVGVGDSPYYMTKKDGTKIKDHFGYRKAIRIAEKKVKMICLGDKYLRAWHERTLKMLKDARAADTRPDPRDAEAIARARRQMGVPEGGPPKSDSPPPEPNGASPARASATSGGGDTPEPPPPERTQPVPSGGGGHDEAPVPISEWGAPKDGKSIPTLAQMQWFTHPNRGEYRMTEAEVRKKTRYELMDLRKEIDGKGIQT